MLSSRLRTAESRERMAPASRPPMCRNWPARSSAAGATRAAASLGVRARTSAARSASVTSISCPTPETTGIRNAQIARTTTSSLNAQRSSKLPPPRVTTRQSIGTVSRLTRADSGGDFLGGPVALNAARDDQHVHPGEAAPQDLQEILQGGPGRTGDHGDPTRKRGERPLAGGIEEPLAGQPVAELAEGQFQGPDAPRLRLPR